MIYKRYVNMPGQVVYRDGTSASRQDYEDFHREVYKRGGGTVASWEVLLNYEPAVRLKIMLGRAAEVMITTNVVTVVTAGLLPQELTLLASVSGMEPRLQTVAHELLCIRERQMYIDAFMGVFNAYKTKE
jgi:hypothetical protein